MSEVNKCCGSLDFEDALTRLVTVARKEFGETEYTYRRVPHTWRGSRRNGSYYSQLTNCPQITKEEYDSKVAEGQANARAAFYGKRTGMPYDTYERVIARDGWREVLLKVIKIHDQG